MASAVVDGDVIQLSIRASCFGQRVLMVRNFLVAEPSNDGLTYVEVMNSILNKAFDNTTGYILAPYLDCVCSNLMVERVRAQRIRPTRDVMVEQLKTISGGRGTANTANVNGTITCRTALAGRNQVATVKVGPIATADSADGVLDGELRANLAALAGALSTPFVDAISGVGLQPYILHTNPLPGQPTGQQITSAVIGSTTRVMRRRTVGVGI